MPAFCTLWGVLSVRDVLLAGFIGLLVESWSFDIRPPSDGETLKLITEADYELLRAAVIAELPDLQRAVHPSPGWRRR